MNLANVRMYPVLIMAGALLALTGCATEPDPSQELETATAPTTEGTQGKASDADTSAAEAGEEPAPQERTEQSEEPAPENGEQPEDEERAAAESPEETEPTEEEAQEEESYEVSEEVYEQTFDEVEQTIQELNEIIRNRNFQAWKEKLTQRYIDTYSSPERLEELSQKPLLERNDIELTSLQDYFRWVVVPSRSNVRLDDLDFQGEDRVEAIMEVRDQAVTLYELRRLDNSWKVDEF